MDPGSDASLSLLKQARDAYVAARYTQALELDFEFLRDAERRSSECGRVLGMRYAALCHYRLGALGEAERLQLAALDLARSIGDLRQQMLLLNHLGATQRRKGDLEASRATFEQGLALAIGPEYASERGRLLGNLGALFDWLEQRDLAMEYYGRYEELMRLTGDYDRLANALGLSGRQARLHGHLDLAETRNREEHEAASRVDGTLRRYEATAHEAELLQARLEASPAAGKPVPDADVVKVRSLFEEARKLGSDLGANRLVSVLVNHAEFETRFGGLREAGLLLDEGRTHLPQFQGQPLERARILEASAEWARVAGLHGEALAYLLEAVELRKHAYTEASGASAHAQTRLDENLTLLTREALSVDRPATELERVRNLVGKTIWDRVHRAPGLPVWSWRVEARGVAETRLRRALGGAWETAARATREDLVGSQIAYRGVIDDMGRSVSLLASTVERELGELLAEPLRAVVKQTPRSQRSEVKVFARPHPPTLGEFVNLLGQGPPFRGLEPVLQAVLGASLLPLLSLASPTRTMDDKHVWLHELRNGVAHGRGQPTRLEVDACLRLLFFSQDAPLVRLLDLAGRARTP